MTTFLTAFFTIQIVLFAHLARGHQSPSVRALSLGGAYRAVANSNDTIFYNPAGLIRYQRLGADVSYQIQSATEAYQIGASIVDAKTTSWGLGLAYSADVHKEVRATQKLNLAMALPLIRHRFFLGGSFFYEHNPTENDFRHFFNLDIGILVLLPAGFSVAVVADHLIRPKGREKGLGLSLGTAFNLAEVLGAVPLSLSFDWLMDDFYNSESLDHVLSAGTQYLLFDVLPLRLGFLAKVKEAANFMSFGSGVLLNNFALDAFYQQHLAIGKIRNFGLALRLNF